MKSRGRHDNPQLGQVEDLAPLMPLNKRSEALLQTMLYMALNRASPSGTLRVPGTVIKNVPLARTVGEESWEARQPATRAGGRFSAINAVK